MLCGRKQSGVTVFADVCVSTTTSSSKSLHSDQKSVDFVGGFFIQADRLGISSRDSVYIIAAFMRRISSHHRCAYLYRLDEIQWLCH